MAELGEYVPHPKGDLVVEALALWLVEEGEGVPVGELWGVSQVVWQGEGVRIILAQINRTRRVLTKVTAR